MQKMQAEVTAYVRKVLKLPLEDRDHLVRMVILHFDIPDKEAKQMVEIAIHQTQ